MKSIFRIKALFLKWSLAESAYGFKWCGAKHAKWSYFSTFWHRWLLINGKARKCKNENTFPPQISMQPEWNNSCWCIQEAHVICRPSKAAGSVFLTYEFIQFLFNEVDIHEMCRSWSGLTLHEDCPPSRMHLPVAPHSRSMLSLDVGLHQLLPSHLTPGGGGRGSGCWCTELRSKILLVLPLIWHRSQVHFCPRWWHLGMRSHLQQEVLNAGESPLSTTESEDCRKQSKLKCSAAC